MTYHVLNGDALTNGFLSTNLKGEIIVVRECLIEGDLQGKTLSQFWQTRAKYIETTYKQTPENYFSGVVSEFEKLIAAPDHSEFNLWFGYDLFCRTNMWFALSLLSELPIQKQIFVVYPSFLNQEDIWRDFGNATAADLITSFKNRVRFNEVDLKLGNDLWNSYKNNSLTEFEKLSRKKSLCLPYLEEVCKAHIDRLPHYSEMGKPERVIAEILQNGITDFYSVFEEFSRREGIYGFGDSQLKQLYEKVMQHP